MTLDPRINPVRPDLAAEHLRGQVDAPRFAEGVRWQIGAGQAPLRAAPRGDAGLLTEALHGETVTVYDTLEGWAWGQLERDRYVGWLPEAALVAPEGAPSHRVTALRTFLFPAPDIKQPPLDALPLNAVLRATDERDGFIRASGGYICKMHLSDAALSGGLDMALDMADVAQRFLGVPYLWGGRTALGIDCSGLVQMAWAACGLEAPRDSDMQYASIGAAVRDGTPETLERNDLIFWKGHVAIALGDGRMIHANAHHMQTAIEPVAAGIARIRQAGQEVLAIRRVTI